MAKKRTAAARKKPRPKRVAKRTRVKPPAKKKPRPKRKTRGAGVRTSKYESFRASQAAISRGRSREGREIGPLPPVKDPARREACRFSHDRFAMTYFPNRFFWPFADCHRERNRRMERCAHEGGRFAIAEPRGGGKTASAEVEVLRAILYGHRRFYVLLQATEPLAARSLRKIKREIETNELLLEDFPEVCYPVRCLEQNALRAKMQTLNGLPTRIEWTAHGITFPTIPGSESSGSMIWVGGITGAVRGLSAMGPSGEILRPDAVLLDDCQTRESAGSKTLTDEREMIIDGDVLGLAGPDKQMAATMLCTAIECDDLSDRYLETKGWQAIRTKMLEEFPRRMDLWEEYWEVRQNSIELGNGGREGNEFYAANRAAMDDGARVSWQERKQAGELSAVQSAMNLYFRNPDVFAAEYQNEPVSSIPEAANALDADAVAARLTNIARRTVPRTCTRLTAAIDVGEHLLWYVVSAIDEKFGGSVIDYGVFPDQQRTHFTKSDPRPALGQMAEFANQPLSAVVYGGLSAVAARIFGATYVQEETGTTLTVERCLVDANYGPLTDLVYEFCRRSPSAAQLLPAHGKFIGASSNPMSTWQRKTGDQAGPGWRKYPGESGRGRHLVVDVNYWKTFAAERLRTPAGGAGAFYLFAPPAGRDHGLLAEHFTSEYPVATSAKGRTVEEWKHHPGRDNDWFDCYVGSLVAASVQGLKWSAAVAAGGDVARKVKKPKRDYLAEFQAQAAKSGMPTWG